MGPTLAQQMQRGELLNVKCPSREVLKHMTSRWGVLVLIALSQGTLRFSELRRKVGGVSEKMLAQTLIGLEDDGLVIRRAFPVKPPHVEYSLSELGQQVGPIVECLADWIESNLPQIMLQRQLKQHGVGEVVSKADHERHR
ncbi:helix-turn-helix domain-containing protein [Acerihabitans sp. TG2]|uniref:winged helix-turn-helix transcriptional regulator n=1 Tax=Acerihabitans sp. TG2 TaxID=3096008 RepID=UPI002B23132D|nr:helix-turn-helix domain-containing protein [Acerihabitans sp. TG2]MEA9389580.1 helix-turn-helix domain-containing protein [Acerihabitans sp. TG2]